MSIQATHPPYIETRLTIPSGTDKHHFYVGDAVKIRTVHNGIYKGKIQSISLVTNSITFQDWRTVNVSRISTIERIKE